MKRFYFSISALSGKEQFPPAAAKQTTITAYHSHHRMPLCLFASLSLPSHQHTHNNCSTLLLLLRLFPKVVEGFECAAPMEALQNPGSSNAFNVSSRSKRTCKVRGQLMLNALGTILNRKLGQGILQPSVRFQGILYTAGLMGTKSASLFGARVVCTLWPSYVHIRQSLRVGLVFFRLHDGMRNLHGFGDMR